MTLIRPCACFITTMTMSGIRVGLIRLAAVSALLLAFSVHGVDIVANGTSDYVIVGDPQDAAVQDLQAFVGEMSGVRLPIVAPGTAAPPKRIVVGASTPEPLGPQAYRLQVVEENVFIYASTPLGASHGVYGLLDDVWGCRFLTANDRFIPSRPLLSVPADLDRRDGPSIRDRLPGAGQHSSIADADWRRRNRVSAELSGQAVHNIYQYLPPKAHVDDHPEWYPLNKDGQREPGCHWLCWTNEAMLAAFTQSVLAKMATNPPDKLLPVGQGDGFSHPCHCTSCRALVDAYGSEAAPLIVALNRVLETTSAAFPRQQLVTFAYFETAVPPIKGQARLQPHPNLHITYVRMGDAMKPLSPDMKARLEDWLSLTPNVNIWSWSVGFRNALCPFPNYRVLAEDTKWYGGKVRGLMHQMYAGGEWGALREWLFARLAWDASLDIEATQQDFLRHFYGEKAAESMWRILDTYQQLAADTDDTFNAVFDSTPANVKRKLFPPPVVEQLQALWEAAIAAAEQGDPVHVARVKETMARSFSMLYFSDAPPLERLEIDGQPWLLPGGNADLAEPAVLLADILRKTILWEWFGPALGRRIFLNNAGGPVTPVIENEALRLGFCLAADGALSSVVDRTTGEELMAVGPRGEGQLTGLRHTVLSDKSGTEHFVETREQNGAAEVVLSSQVVTNAWMAFNALRNERVFRLEPERSGFTVASSLFADSSLPGFSLFTIPNYRNDTFRLYLDEPIYDTRIRVAFQVHAPEALGLTIVTPQGRQRHAPLPPGEVSLPVPADREPGGRVHIQITGVSSDKVLALTTPWDDWLQLGFSYNPERAELIFTCEGPKKAAVKDVRVPTGELALDLMTPSEAEQALLAADQSRQTKTPQ